MIGKKAPRTAEHIYIYIYIYKLWLFVCCYTYIIIIIIIVLSAHAKALWRESCTTDRRGELAIAMPALCLFIDGLSNKLQSLTISSVFQLQANGYMPRVIWRRSLGAQEFHHERGCCCYIPYIHQMDWKNPPCLLPTQHQDYVQVLHHPDEIKGPHDPRHKPNSSWRKEGNRCIPVPLCVCVPQFTSERQGGSRRPAVLHGNNTVV